MSKKRKMGTSASDLVAGKKRPAQCSIVRPLIFEPKTEPCQGAVIWLHGFGDDPEGWDGPFQNARKGNPSLRWVHLRAPRRPQTCAGGMKESGWGDYLEEDCTRVGSADYESPDANGWYAETAMAVHETVDELESSHGIAPERVIIGGFSQGATAAAQSAVTCSKRLAGVVILNGWLLPAARAALSAGYLRGVPVLVSHGDRDEMVAFGCGEAAVKLLQEAGADVKFIVQKGGTHVESGFTAGRDAAVKFIAGLLR